MNDESFGGFAGKLAHLMAALDADPKVKPIDWKKQDVAIERVGSKITLPAEPGPMPIPVAIDSLKRLQADEERMMEVAETFDAHPLEALVAFNEAMRISYGWASPVPTPGFWGSSAPSLISVQVDVDEWVQVPFGSFKMPGIENPVTLSVNRQGKLVASGEVRKREKSVLLDLAAATRAILKSRSIYRGKALHIAAGGDGKLDLAKPPTFMDLRGTDPSALIFNRDIERQIEVNIFAPIRHTAKVRSAGIPLKRGVLLEGTYGVGKTLTTRVTAQACVEHGWTFITIDRAASLTEALIFAQRYQPAVVFCEDIDRGVSARTDKANDLLNTIGGILSEKSEVMVVLTTNHVERIDPAMLRPGRLDAVISVLPPDAEAVTRLVRLYARDTLALTADLTAAGEELAGAIPAVVREVVERSKLAMISAGRDVIEADDLVVMAKSMAAHRALVDGKPAALSSGDELAAALRKVVLADVSNDFIATLEKLIDSKLG